MSYFSCVLLFALLTHIACQDCSSLTIEAIYPCTANFLLDNTSTCMLSSCYAKNPGNPVNLTNSTACFVSCCPGFMVPTSITKDSMTLCYNQYNGTPDLVYVIGILIAIFMLAIFMCLPCCANKECPIYRARERVTGCLTGKRPRVLKKKENEKETLKAQESKLFINQNNYVQEPITLELDVSIGELEDKTSSPSNICLICSKERASSRLPCKHFYHLDCLATSWHYLSNCALCESKSLFPLHYFCEKCFKTYSLRSSLAKPSEPFICSNCKN